MIKGLAKIIVTALGVSVFATSAYAEDAKRLDLGLYGLAAINETGVSSYAGFRVGGNMPLTEEPNLSVCAHMAYLFNPYENAIEIEADMGIKYAPSLSMGPISSIDFLAGPGIMLGDTDYVTLKTGLGARIKLSENFSLTTEAAGGILFWPDEEEAGYLSLSAGIAIH